MIQQSHVYIYQPFPLFLTLFHFERYTGVRIDSRPVHLQIIITWFMPCRGAQDINTIPRSHTNIPVPLSTTYRAYPYPHPQHRIDGILTSKDCNYTTSYWGGVQNEIHIMRETPRAWFRLNSSSAFSAHAHNSMGPPQWLIPDPQQVFIGEEAKPGSHTSSCKHRLEGGGGIDFHSLAAKGWTHYNSADNKQ